MTYGVIQAGRLTLREDASVQVSRSDTGVGLELSGQESYGRLTLSQLRQRADEIMALAGRMIPMSFSQKNHLDGYYWVEEASGRYEEWQPEAVSIMPWSLTLVRRGYAADADLESRLSGPVTRANDHLATGERWHGPPVGHTAYSAGSTLPSVVVRTGSEGAMSVYRDLTPGIHPRWSATPAAYALGRSRFIDASGFERQAVRTPLAPVGWQMHNGLVQVSVDGATGALNVAAWTGGAWQSILWDVYHGTGPAVAMGAPTSISLLRNEFECVAVRLVKALSPGRMTVDLTLRRGSRFVEVYVQHEFGTTLAVQRRVAEASAASTGYLSATAPDAAGNRYVVGSTRTFVADNVQGKISIAATPSLDAMIGVQVGGAAAGDLGADLFTQYLGVAEETVRAVRR